MFLPLQYFMKISLESTRPTLTLTPNLTYLKMIVQLYPTQKSAPDKALLFPENLTCFSALIYYANTLNQYIL